MDDAQLLEDDDDDLVVVNDINSSNGNHENVNYCHQKINSASQPIGAEQQCHLNNDDRNGMPNQNNESEANRKRRFNSIGLLIFSSLYTFFFGGAFYGWGPMQLMLEENGSYSSKCNGDDSSIICAEQTLTLQRIQFVATLTVLFCPILGMISDKYNTLVIIYIMIFISIIALILLALAVEYIIDPLLYVSFVCFGIVASITSLLSVTTGICLYPDHDNATNNNDSSNTSSKDNDVYRCRVISALSALYDAGSITYLGFWALTKSTGMSLTDITILYAAIAVVCFVGGLYFWIQILAPSDTNANTASTSTISKRTVETLSIEDQDIRSNQSLEPSIRVGNETTWNESNEPTNVPNEFSDDIIRPNNDDFIGIVRIATTTHNSESEIETHTIESNSKSNNEIKDDNISESNDRTELVRYVKISERTPRQQLLSEPFIMLCIVFAMNTTHNQYILITTRDWLAYLGDDDVGNKYLTIFTFLLPVSVLGLPFVDYIVKNYGYYYGLQMINILSIMLSTIKLSTDNMNVQVLGFIVFSIFRCFLFGVALSFVPNLLCSKYVSGKGVGIMFFANGIFSFINFPLSSLAVDKMDGNFFYSNLIMGLLTIPSIIAVWRIGIYIKKDQQACS